MSTSRSRLLVRRRWATIVGVLLLASLPKPTEAIWCYVCNSLVSQTHLDGKQKTVIGQDGDCGKGKTMNKINCNYLGFYYKHLYGEEKILIPSVNEGVDESEDLGSQWMDIDMKKADMDVVDTKFTTPHMMAKFIHDGKTMKRPGEYNICRIIVTDFPDIYENPDQKTKLKKAVSVTTRQCGWKHPLADKTKMGEFFMKGNNRIYECDKDECNYHSKGLRISGGFNFVLSGLIISSFFINYLF